MRDNARHRVVSGFRDGDRSDVTGVCTGMTKAIGESAAQTRGGGRPSIQHDTRSCARYAARTSRPAKPDRVHLGDKYVMPSTGGQALVGTGPHLSPCLRHYDPPIRSPVASSNPGPPDQVSPPGVSGALSFAKKNPMEKRGVSRARRVLQRMKASGIPPLVRDEERRIARASAAEESLECIHVSFRQCLRCASGSVF